MLFLTIEKVSGRVSSIGSGTGSGNSNTDDDNDSNIMSLSFSCGSITGYTNIGSRMAFSLKGIKSLGIR